jgi:hypothetical protein
VALHAPAGAPAPPSEPLQKARVALRFEDVTQDGRVVLEALPNALDPTIWRGALPRDPGAQACFARGIVPILSRFVLEGTPGPFPAYAPVEAEATYRLARLDSGGFVLDMWAELSAPLGRGHDVPGAESPRAVAGRVFAEHVLTRPFGPPGERRVTVLAFDAAPDVPASRPALAAADVLQRLPAGARALDAEPRLDPTPVTFGVVHTDSNQHVNSLAYLRLFEEAALRRFAELGRGSRVLARRIEIAYRKPCFAGERVRAVLRAFEGEGGRLGVTGALIDDASEGAADGVGLASLARPRTAVSMDFEG